jgi:hypothetical protein
MLYREIIIICSEIHTKHINTHRSFLDPTTLKMEAVGLSERQ